MYFAKAAAAAIASCLIGAAVTSAQTTYDWITTFPPGYYEHTVNWNPAANPGPLDAVEFDIGGVGYGLWFGISPTADRALIEGDDVTFGLLERAYTLVGAETGEALRVEQVAGIGSLQIHNGWVYTTGSVVVDSDVLNANYQLTVNGNGNLSASDLYLGQGVSGNMLIDTGGRVEVDGVIRLADNGSSEVYLDGWSGPAEVWNNPSGSGSTGLAHGAGTTANLTLDGPEALWQTSVLFMGQGGGGGGAAYVRVLSDAQLVVQGPIFIGNDPGTMLEIDGGAVIAEQITLTGAGTFNFMSGTLNLTNDDLTVGSAGLFGGNVMANGGDHITISGTTTVETGHVIDIFAGGSFSTGVLDVQGDPGRLNWVDGGLGLTNQDLTVDTGELLGDSILLDAGHSLVVGGTTTVQPAGHIWIFDGSFSTGSLDLQGDPGRLSFGSGEFKLTNSDLTLDGSDLFNGNVYLNSGMSLGISGTTTVTMFSNLDIDGGTFSTGSLDISAYPSGFNWMTGTLNLTNDDLDVTAGGLLGDTVLVDASQSLGVNGQVLVAPDGLLHVGDGSMTVGQSTEHSAPTTLRIDTGGLLDIQGDAVVGSLGLSSGPGILTMESGSTLELTGGHLRALDLDLQSGTFLDWQTGTLELTTTDITLDPTGRFSDELIIDRGKELILGEDFVPGIGWIYVSNLGVHNEFIVRDGGLATTDSGVIDQGGTATVQGPGSRWTLRDSLLIADGLVRVEAGGLLEAEYISVASSVLPTGHLLIEGPGSTVDINGGIEVVDDARLTIRDGATLNSADATVHEFGAVTGPQVLVQGAGSTWDIELVLDIGTNPSATQLSTVTVMEGGTIDAGTAHVRIYDPGNLIIDTGLFVADTFELETGGDLGGSGPGSTLRVNQLIFPGTNFSYPVDLQIGHAQGTGTGSLTLDAESLDLFTGGGEFVVGYDAPANVTFQNGSSVYTLNTVIGEDVGGHGTVTLTGLGTQWDEAGLLSVGGESSYNDNGGDGTLNLQGQAQLTTMGARIGIEPGATGIVNVSGAGTKWTNCCSNVDEFEWLVVGVRGAGELHITNGGEVESHIIGAGFSLVNAEASASGVITVDGTNSLLDAYGLMIVGGVGTGDVTASNNGHIEANQLKVLGRGHVRIESAASMTTDTEVWIGENGADVGRVTITGPGSDWTNTAPLHIGFNAEAELIVENDADMTTTGVTEIGQLGGPGRVIARTNGHVLFDNIVTVGFLGGSGELHALDGGLITLYNSPLRVGYVTTSTGLIEVDGTGSHLNAAGVTIELGSLGGVGDMNIRDGGQVTSGDGLLGVGSGSDGVVLIEDAGSEWNLDGELSVGTTNIGLINVRDSGSGSSDTIVIGDASGSEGTANWDFGGSWTASGRVTVGRSGDGYLRVIRAAQVTNATTFIADNAGSLGQAQVYGTGSLWNTTGNMYVGGDSTSSGGDGTLIVGNGLGTGGTITVGSTLTVRAPGTVSMNGGTLNAGQLSTVNGTWTWGGGTFNLTDPTFDFVVGAVGPFGSTLTIPADNLMTVAGETHVEAGALLDAAGFTCNNAVVNDGTIRSSGHVTLGDPTIYQAYSGNGLLDINTNQVTLNTLGFLELDFDMSMTGGKLTVPNGVLLRTTRPLELHGTIEGPFAQEMGTEIVAIGDLELGDATRPDGFFSHGILDVGDHTVTLNDANQAVLGSLTRLSRYGASGTLAASTAVTIDIGNNVAGFGDIDSPDTPLIPLINNGDISGNSLAEPITLKGYVKGIGTFNNVTFDGTFAPGFSPATIYLGNARYAGTLEVELGGLTEGESDLLHHNGDLILGGVLDVALWDGFVPMPGSVIDIMTYTGALSGAFTGVVNNTGYEGLILDYTTDADSVMITTGYLAGDLNLDGFVGIEDLNTVLSVWNQNVTAGDIFQGDPSGDGFVGIEDLNVVLGNWNAGTPPQDQTNIPEPGSFAMLLLSGTALVRRGKR